MGAPLTRAVRTEVDPLLTAGIAARARRRWRALVAMSDAEVVAHVLTATSEPPAPDIRTLDALRELYRDALVAGAAEAYLVGLATAADVAARHAGVPAPRWLTEAPQ